MSPILAKIFSFIMSIIFLFQGAGSLASYEYTEEMKNNDNYTPLKEVYADYNFKMGASAWAGELDRDGEFFLKNFEVVSPTEGMRPTNINPAKDQWNFNDPDRIAAFCRQNNIKMRCHMLLWQALYDNWWMCYDDSGNLVDKKTWEDRLHHYMDVVINRYKDIVYAWDVINEPFYYTYGKDMYKDGPVLKIYGGNGREMVTNTFRMAREIAGPDAVLVLNETKCVNNDQKFNKTYKEMKALLADGVPIDAIGIQCHYEALSIKETGKRLDNVINKFAGLGLRIHITEATVYSTHDFDSQTYETIPRYFQSVQNRKWKEMFETIRKNADKIDYVVTWGMSDRYMYDKGGKPCHPTLFDENNVPKECYWAAIDF